MADPTGEEDREIQGQQGSPPGDADDGVSPFSTNVQILGLSSNNPIISYLDQVYSCTWTDMVGTNMFFTNPGLINPAAALQATDDYDLIGMSRIKLVGDRAAITRKAGSKRQGQPTDARAEEQPPEEDINEPAGRSLGSLTRNNAKVNVHIKKQATFLKKLMDLKRQRGEGDLVRTYVDETIAATDNQNLPQEIQTEVEELNRRLLKGDGEALARLQEIYFRSARQDLAPGGTAHSPEHQDGSTYDQNLPQTIQPDVEELDPTARKGHGDAAAVVQEIYSQSAEEDLGSGSTAHSPQKEDGLR